MRHWGVIELDLQDRGIDLGDHELLRKRSWRWLRLRIVGLVWEPGTRTQRVLQPDLTPVFLYGAANWQRINGLRKD